MARSISNSVTQLRSSLSDIRTAFANKGVTVPSNLKVSQVSQYIDSTNVLPSISIDIDNFSSYWKNNYSTVKRLIFCTSPADKSVPYPVDDDKTYSDTGTNKVKIHASYADGNGVKQNNPTTAYIYPYRENITYPCNMDLKYVDQMFWGCDNIEEVYFQAPVTFSNGKLEEMFFSCDNLKIVDMMNCDFSNVTRFGSMFMNDSNLTVCALPISRVYKPTVLYGMFSDCFKLYSVALNVNPVNLEGDGVDSMFSGCSNLRYIYVNKDYPDWTTNSVVKNSTTMFRGCPNLDKASSGSGGEYAKYSGGNFYYFN